MNVKKDDISTEMVEENNCVAADYKSANAYVKGVKILACMNDNKNVAEGVSTHSPWIRKSLM